MSTRRERVVLELEDKFSAEMAGAAAKTALLNRELKNLDGTSTSASRSNSEVSKSTKSVGDETEKTSKKTREYTAEMALADEKSARLRKSLRDQAKAALDAGNEIDHTGNKTEAAGRKIDRLSGRMQLLTEAAVTLGPALIPIGAAAIPALSGLTMGFTVAAGAAGTALLAFHGVGDALKALDAAQLEPTAANLAKMRDEMDKLGPSGAHFVRYLDSLEPQLRELQMTARAGLFPGVEDGIDNFLTMLPQVRSIVGSLAREMGSLARQAGEGLSGQGFASFFRYLETDAAPTLAAFGHTIGNLAEGFANLLVAFAPLSRSFNSGMESMSRSFADWAAGLSATDGFRNFVDYVQQSGPQVADLLGAMSNAFVGIIRAAAPVGQVIVPALTALANVLGAIANSPVGPAIYTGVAAMLALNRITTLTTASMIRFGATAETAGLAAGKVGSALQVAGVALGGMLIVDKLQTQFEGVSTSVGTLSTKLLALSQAGAGAKLSGEFSDIASSFDRLADPNKAQALQDTLNGWLGTSDSRFDKAKGQIEAIDAALKDIATTQGAGAANRSFDALAKSMHLTGAEQAKLLAMLPGYRAATTGATDANDRQASALRRVADAAGNSKSQLEGLTKAMQEQRQVALAAFDAETNYRQALKEAGKQAAKNNAGIRGNSKAVLENRGALSALAAAWNGQSKAVKNSESRYQSARAALIQTAVQMGVTRAQAEQLANRILEIPKSHVTQISLSGSDKALNDLYAIAQAARNIPREWSTTYYVNQVNSISKISQGANQPVPQADGGTVPRTGKPYADRHHYLLADGEEVISNRYGQADRNRALLKAINAGRLADGGTATRYASGMRGHGASGGRVEHVVTVRVKGEMDLRRATAQIREVATEISRGEIDADHAYGNTLKRMGMA